MVTMIKRWRWAIVIGALLLAGLGVAFWPEAVPVDTGTVTRGAMAVGVTDDGVTRAEDTYVVSAPVAGYLSRIELEAGDVVERGALIAYVRGRPATPLDPRSAAEMRSALASAMAAASGAAASQDQAIRDLARAESLARRGFLPRAQLEAARTRVASERASLRAQRAEVGRIQALLSEPAGAGSAPVAVRAPASGSVLRVVTESEGIVAEGARILTIGDPGRIEVVVDLLSRDAVRVKAGDRVEITGWGGAAPIVGKVQRVEPFGFLKVSALGIEEQRVNVIVSIDGRSASEAARLGDGYQIDATIILWSRKDALRVPIGALFRGTDGAWRAFTVAGGRARERQLKIGYLNDEFGEVLNGLAEGDPVIINPGNDVADGKRVAARQD